MGRPSLKAQRKNQILDAAESCILKFGLSGLTLEKIGLEANMARPLVRHNMGNRSEIIEALIDRFLVRSAGLTKEYVAHLGQTKPLTELVDLLFGPKYSNSDSIALGNALLVEASNTPEISEKMKAWSNNFIQQVLVVARRQFPKNDEDQLRDIVIGVCGLYFISESIQSSGDIDGFKDSSFRSAKLLISLL
jgi:AcrR family transcriptional regulator